MSPEVGLLDEAAVREAMVDDLDATLALVADLAAATDETLRALARRLAAQLFLDIARRGPSARRGTGRIAEQPYRPDGGDLDLDASFEAIAEAVATDSAVDADRLRIRAWQTPATALCLVVDRSGSMGGRPLATAALAAAAVAMREPAGYSVLAFAKDVVALKQRGADVPAERVVTDVLALRGHGSTDLAGALTAAADDLAVASATRRIAILLSDCRSTVSGDVVAAAARLPELAIIAPASDCDEAAALATATGGRLATVSGPSDVVRAIGEVLRR